MDSRRVKSISGYLQSQDAVLPGTIIIAANCEEKSDQIIDIDGPNSDKRWGIETANGVSFLTIPTLGPVAKIVDGQHRLAGFLSLNEDLQETLLPCAVFLDLPMPHQAYIFATINFNQKPVSKSLSYELFGYNLDEESESEWAPDKLAVSFTRQLNIDAKSSLKDHIKVAVQDDRVLDEIFIARKKEWVVSTATIVEGIISLISTNSQEDRDKLKSVFKLFRSRSKLELGRNPPPLRDWFIKGDRDIVIYKTVRSFFNAVDVLFWRTIPTGSKSLIRKTAGIQAGFAKGQKHLPEDQLAIATRQLKDGWNDRAYIRMAVRLLNEYSARLNGEEYNHVYAMLLDNRLLHDYTATKENILKVYDCLKDEYVKKLHRVPIVRCVDFNQGMDARLVTPENMAKLSEISIRPLRIAFDHWEGRKFYVRALRLAQENGITQMSNYLLYNFRDTPLDLYRRLLINIDLCDALNINIYSFPMKYHPIMDEKWFTNRDYIDQPNWSRKAIRTVQAILNSTHGKIGRGRTFFFKAFGRSEAEFSELIQMPEAFIIKRWDAELNGLTQQWRAAYQALSPSEKEFAEQIISTNAFDSKAWEEKSRAVKKLLDLYLLKREEIPLASEKKKAKAISNFETECPAEITEECKNLLEKSYW